MTFEPRATDSGIVNQADDWRFRASSLVEVFRRHAESDRDRVAFSQLAEEDKPGIDIPYGELDDRARAIAARLQQLAPPGARALLTYGPGLDYITALAGCLYAGVAAVPVYPPDPMRIARTLPRLEGIIRDAGASLILGTASDIAWTRGLLGNLPNVEGMLATDEIGGEGADRWVPVKLDRESLAILQYTSGSTGEPKGVMVRHGNILHNLWQMERTIDVPHAVAVTWLPAYHDMGLIGGILQCWYSRRRNVILSPLAFFQRPLRWLQAIAENRATTAGAPDFAYELCVRKTTESERRELDLSSWQIALSGAEPVRAETIERFLEAFAVSGVRREVFRPCFGLAEATLMVTCSSRPRPPAICNFDAGELTSGRAVEVSSEHPAAREIVGCGPSVVGQRLVIVDPQTRVELSAGGVGEIWVAGKNVAAGYWNRPEETSATFAARTADGDGPYLRTGDAGFLHQEEVFISGRLKELLIVHGRNHFPQDLEYTVEHCHPAFNHCRGAAFSLDVRGREQVVLVHEVSRPKKHDLEEVARIARWAVLDAHDVLVDSLVLIRQGTLPKTTSGKVQRHVCRQLYRDRQLQSHYCWRAPRSAASAQMPEAYSPPRTPTERLLAETWAEVLGVPRVGIFDNFIELGGHSLLAAQLVNRLGPRLGVDIPLSELFSRPTIAQLAELIGSRSAERDDIERQLLDTLEMMSEEDVRNILSVVKNAGIPLPQDTPIG